MATQIRRLSRSKSILSLKSTKSFSVSLRRIKPLFRFRHRRPSTSEPPQQPQPPPESRLLALPPELRNEVYTYALCYTTPTSRIELNNLHLPPLLRTCHQILLEGISIFFACNYFVWTVTFTRWKEVGPITTFPFQNIKTLLGSKSEKIGPILDMTLEFWMPWVFLQGLNNWCDPHSVNIAHLKKPAEGERWIPSTGHLPVDIAAMLEAWSPPGDPSFEQVMREVVWSVWYYYKVIYAFGDLGPRTIREGRFKRLKRKVLDWLDAVLIGDRMSDGSSSLSSV